MSPSPLFVSFPVFFLFCLLCYIWYEILHGSCRALWCFFIGRSFGGSLFASHGFEGVMLSGLFVRGVRACQGMLANGVEL